MMKRINFHARVLLSFVAILVLALASAASAMYVVANRATTDLALQQLNTAARLTDDTMANRYAQLLASARPAAADFGFREAVTTRDRATIVSALENESSRLQADAAAWIDNSNTVVASTNKQFTASLANEPEPSDGAHAGAGPLLYNKGRLMHLVVVPVQAPDKVGSLCLGFFLNDQMLAQVKEVSGVDVTFVVQLGNSIDAPTSTLKDADRDRITGDASSLLKDSRSSGLISINGTDYLTAVTSTRAIGSNLFAIVLRMPMTAAAAPMVKLRHELTLAVGFIAVVCLAAALLSSRMLAKPVRALSDAARSLNMSKRQGGGKTAADDDELAHVAKSFHSLLKRAHYDALTGLPNRTLLNEKLAAAIVHAQAKRTIFALVFIDLNGFKAINDTLGHEMGDLVLRKTAQRLSRSLAQSHTVARLGGDEFVLLLNGLSREKAVLEVERLSVIVSSSMKGPAGSIKVGMSAGIALYPETATEQNMLLKAADTAMYTSKQRKRGPVVATTVLASVTQPEAEPASKTADEPQTLFDSTGAHWSRKDLSTQRSKVVPLVAVDRGARIAYIPPDEKERLVALHRINILDTAPSSALDRVTRMTAKALGVPIVLVSLVDEHRQWFVSKVGLAAAETSREVSFCAHAIFDRQPLIVPDATLDARFANNPLVENEPKIRAYAGAPIYSTGGYALGTLCAIDRKARDFSEEAVDTLQEFAEMIQDLIRAREVGQRPAKANQR